MADWAESDYVNYYCTQWKGVIEYVLPDRTRVDCLTDTHAIEFDWCRKWAEAIGQSLYYSKMTGKTPQIVLICKPNENRFVERLKIASDVQVIIVNK